MYIFVYTLHEPSLLSPHQPLINLSPYLYATQPKILLPEKNFLQLTGSQKPDPVCRLSHKVGFFLIIVISCGS